MDRLRKNMSHDDVVNYVKQLQQKVNETWDKKITQGRFMQELGKGTLPIQTIRLYYRNWGAFVMVINSLYAAAIYKHNSFFVSNPDLMAPYGNKLVDEFGTPQPPGHILILLRTGEALGLTKEEIIGEPMLPGARALGDFHRTLMWDGTVPEYWASILWEQPMGHYAAAWFEALTKHYGLSGEEATYFSTHHEADLQEHHGFIAHGELNQTVLIRTIETGYVERPGYPLEYCALAPVDLNDIMMRAVLEASGR